MTRSTSLRLDADAGQGLGDRRASEAHLSDVGLRNVLADAGVDEHGGLRMAHQPRVDDDSLAGGHRVGSEEAADQEPGHDRSHRPIMRRPCPRDSVHGSRAGGSPELSATRHAGTVASRARTSAADSSAVPVPVSITMSATES